MIFQPSKSPSVSAIAGNLRLALTRSSIIWRCSNSLAALVLRMCPAVIAGWVSLYMHVCIHSWRPRNLCRSNWVCRVLLSMHVSNVSWLSPNVRMNKNECPRLCVPAYKYIRNTYECANSEAWMHLQICLHCCVFLASLSTKTTNLTIGVKHLESSSYPMENKPIKAITGHDKPIESRYR